MTRRVRLGSVAGAEECVVRDLKIADTDFDLLRAIGGECAGALSILPLDQEPLRKVLSRMHVRAPVTPTICNVTGGYFTSSKIICLMEERASSLAASTF